MRRRLALFLAIPFAIFALCVSNATAKSRLVAKRTVTTANHNNVTIIKGKDWVKIRKITRYNFKYTEIIGKLHKPSSKTFSTHKVRKFDSLIGYRISFQKELQKTARNL